MGLHAEKCSRPPLCQSGDKKYLERYRRCEGGCCGVSALHSFAVAFFCAKLIRWRYNAKQRAFKGPYSLHFSFTVCLSRAYVNRLRRVSSRTPGIIARHFIPTSAVTAAGEQKSSLGRAVQSYCSLASFLLRRWRFLFLQRVDEVRRSVSRRPRIRVFSPKRGHSAGKVGKKMCAFNRGKP